jgi:hypothetical protein
VLPTLLFRGWQIIAGGLMVLLIPLWLDKVEQGYYFTFASVLALQIFFELGMNQVIIQLVSHDFAHIRTGKDGQLTGDAKCIARLAELVMLLRRWYGIAAALFFVMISIGGAWFFSTKGNLPLSAWIGPWVLLTLGTAFNLYLSATLTVLEGCGEVAGVARMRTVQSIGGNILMWLALSMGVGLWAMPLVPIVGAGYTIFWLHTNGGPLDRLRRYAGNITDKDLIRWRSDIFPFQWRIAVSWVSGYLIFQLFTPLAFAQFGAEEAGRLGITMLVFSGLVTVGMSWVNAKLPAFAAHVSRGERASLNALFKSVVKRSMIFVFVVSMCIILAVIILTRTDTGLIHRFASIPVFVCMVVVALTQCFIFSAAAYMRAHKEEPMMLNSVVIGLLTLLGSFIGSRYDVQTMIAVYAAINVLVGLPWTLILFKKYYFKGL